MAAVEEDQRLAKSAKGERCFIIGEVAQAHDGSLGFAHAFIDIVASAGLDAVKFQTHIADAESTPSEPWRVKFSKQDATRFEYWQRMEFTEPQWVGLREHANERGLCFMSSPFSLQAVELLDRVGVAAWKVASGEVTSLGLIERMASTGQRVILSSGMSTWPELDAAVEVCLARGAPVTLLQCNSAYPCPPEKVGLNVLGELRERYGQPVGLSDHSGTTYPSIAAVALGASMIEVHVTFSPDAFGPDVPASLTASQLADLVRGVRFIEQTIHHPVDKDDEALAMAPMRQLFTKSVVMEVPRRAGHTLDQADLGVKKPGSGVPGTRIDEFVGRTLRIDAPAGHVLRPDDVEPALEERH